MKQENLSISNSDWNKFLRLLITTTFGTLSCLYLSIYLIDPYDLFVLSPEISRSPITSKRRLANPGIARKAHFDSFILGTSTVMLLNPQRLDSLLDAKIANLSLPAASPYEQLRMASLFMEYHDKLNLVIISIDKVWCTINGNTKYIDVGNDKLVEKRHIQEWMYSSNFWDQLPPLNSRIVKHTRRQLSAIFGLRDSKYHSNGYGDFTKGYAKKYDQTKILTKLYGSSKPKLRPALLSIVNVSELTRKQWAFADIEMLKKWLASLSISTRKILLFPPYHHFHQPQIGSRDEVRWNECKSRVANIGPSVSMTTVVDFMYRSSITTDDSNYWDPVHYTLAIANKIENTLGHVLMDQPSEINKQSDAENSNYYKVLSWPLK